MNQKIRDLAEQSGFFPVPDETEVDLEYHAENARYERFAELIVRECSKVIVNGGYRNPALGEKHPLTPPEIARMIEEHFGVDE